MHDLYLELAGQQLDHLNGQSRLVVIHPHYLTQRYLLDMLLTDNTVYLRFNIDNATLEECNAQLTEALTEQVESTTLDHVQHLILDECDRIGDNVFDPFLESITQQVIQNNSGRVIIISRRVPRYVVNAPEVKPNSTFLPVDGDLLLCDYIREQETPALLEVHSFGAGRVYLNGREVNSWDGVLPRSLFFYIVDRGMTTRDDIFRIFWPKLTTKEATNVFHVTKRKISEVLGIDLTTYWSGFYRISADIELNYDAMIFSKLVQDSAVAAENDAKILLRRAISLYRGEFLTSLNLEWTQNRRQSLLQTYGEALVSLAKMSEDANERSEALGLYLRASLANPQREDLVLSIMTLYADLDMPEDALTCYKRLEEELNENLGVKPAPELREFAASLRERVT